ncbi:MAG: alginate lyase family protein [Pseudomonadota bacterium]
MTAILLALVPAAFACIPVPSAVPSLALKRFYVDPSGSRSKHSILASNRRITAPVKRYLNLVAEHADRAVMFRSGRDAVCALTALQAWAQAGALLGPMPTKQGEHHRKWAFTGLALAYLKVATFADPATAASINAWLQTMADDASALFATGKVKLNNHYYWLGLGLTATGLATGSQSHIARGQKIFRKALADIDEVGAFSMEMARGARALHYQVFALTPLVIMDYLLARQSGLSDRRAPAALRRAVTFAMSAVRNPNLIAARAKARQKDVPMKRRLGYGWLRLIAASPARWPDVEIGSFEFATASTTHRWIGGDATALTVLDLPR